MSRRGTLDIVRSFFVLVAYSAILAVVAMPRGLETEYVLQLAPLTPMASNQQMQEVFGPSDAGSYARGGVEMAAKGWITSPGFLSLWPPGMFYLHAAAIHLVGADGPVLLVLICATVGAWALVMTMVQAFARESLPTPVALVAPLVFLAFPFFRDYFLGAGVMMSESLSAAFWSIGTLLLFFGLRTRGWRLGVAAGGAFALGAYVRGQVYAVTHLGTGILLLLCIGIFVRWLLRRRRGTETRSFLEIAASQRLGILLAMVISFQGLMAPYLFHNLQTYGRYEMGFFDYYYRYLWTPPEHYRPVARFILDGGGPVACHVEPELCTRMAERRASEGKDVISNLEYRSLAISAFFRNPVSWTIFRLKHLPPYWFSVPSMTTVGGADYVTGVILALLLAVGWLLLIPLVTSPYFTTLLFSMLSLGVATGAVFVLVHYEVRYLYHFQFGIVLFALLGSVLLARQRLAAPTDDRDKDFT